MTIDELAAKRVREAVDRLKRQWADELIAHADLTETGDALRRVTAIRASVADQIVIEITMELQRQ